MDHDPPILMPKRRGQGTLEDPWRWSGRFRLHDVDGRYVATLGATMDVEEDAWNLANEAGTKRLYVQILLAGRKTHETPTVQATLHAEGTLTCRMRGAHWGLGQLLGRSIPKDGLVTIRAWHEDATSRTRASLDQERAEERELAGLFDAFLATRRVEEAFALHDILQVKAHSPMGRRLSRMAQQLAARGVLAASRMGRQRVYVLVKHPHPGAAGG